MNPVLLDKALTGAFGVLDDLITTPEEKAQIQLQFIKVREAAKMAQIGVNAKEAEHKSMFIAGWRPAVAWVCVLSFAYNFFFLPIIHTAAFYYAQHTGVPFDLTGLPTMETAEMLTVLGGLLGFGGWRSLDKIKGVASTSLNRKAMADGQ